MAVASLFVALLVLGFLPISAQGAERLARAEAVAAADQDPKVVEEEREHGALGPTASLDDDKTHWEVAYFGGGEERVLVLVDARSGEVTESWTGYQVAWKMARGYSGAFGHKLNAPYVFLPLCLLFLLGLVDWRRLWRVDR